MKNFTLSCVLVAVALSTSANAATTIYEDDFSGLLGDNLSGTTPDTTVGSNTWTADSVWKADGSATAPTNGGGGAFLPLSAGTISAGQIYTFQFDIATRSADSGGGRSLYLGFSGADQAFQEGELYFRLNYQGSAFSVDLSGGAAVQTGFASATQGVFSLSLDTTNPTWTAQWSDSSGAIGTQPQYNLSSATQTALGGAGNVGFLLVNTANNKTISVDLNSFSLATNASAVPEPTGVVAGLLIAIGLIRRRR